MPAPFLVDSCIKACIKNIRSLVDVGDFEYWKIRTVLQRIDSPEQLRQVELNSPQIQGEDAELWQAFISRDIPNWRSKNYAPKNPLKWYQVYQKYKKEQRQEIARDEEILRNTMLGIKKAQEANVSKVVDLRSLPKVPKDPRMLANNGGVPIGGRKNGFVKPGATSLVWNAGSKTKMSDGQSVLTRARREAREISQRGRLAKPSHELKGRAGQVQKAPAGMVNEYRKAAEPQLRILSRKKMSFTGGISAPSLEEREKRLMALTMAGSKRDAAGGVNETFVGSSDDDMEDEDEIDDLFDDSSKPQAQTSRPTTSSRPTHASSSSPVTLLESATKPSDLISSLVSKPKPQPRSTSPSSPPAPSKNIAPLAKAASPSSRTASPALGARRPMMPRKRVEVDVFNRGSKKPRVR
ncbi:hypothetical protein B7494_g2048 [Chlorociboria aeruginascens]|nr:hypothetical protein B7494_g2048 [Chlorociboria aeruginascens]